MRKKLEHWWTYHKGIVIFAVVLAAAVLYVAGTMGKKEKTQILMGEVVNNVQDDAVTTRMEEAILAGIGGDPNGEEVVVDTALTMDAAALGQTPIADANTQDSLATITTYVYAHELDFMILEKDVFDYYCNLNAFADLRELLGAGACEALGARIYEKNGVACGITLTDTAFVKQYGITLLDPVIGIVSGSERKEQAVGMLRWIFEENAGVAAAFSAEEYKAMISQEETGRKDDGKNVWRFMGKVTDMFFLTCLWLLFSLPVVTIGAATCALCYCSMTLASNKEGYIREDFVRAFKENFKSATIAWIGMLALGIFFGADLYFYYHLAGGVGMVFFWIFLVLSVIFVFVALYVFPLLAWTDADLKKTLALAFVMSFKNFGWTLLMLTSAALFITAALFVFWPLLFVSVGGIAYVHAKILAFVFSQYKWRDEGKDGSDND